MADAQRDIRETGNAEVEKEKQSMLEVFVCSAIGRKTQAGLYLEQEVVSIDMPFIAIGSQTLF